MGLALSESAKISPLLRVIGIKDSHVDRELQVSEFFLLGLLLGWSWNRISTICAPASTYWGYAQEALDTLPSVPLIGIKIFGIGWVVFCGLQGPILLKVRIERHWAPLTLLKIFVNKALCLRHSSLNTRSFSKHNFPLALSVICPDKLVLDMLLIYFPLSLGASSTLYIPTPISRQSPTQQYLDFCLGLNFYKERLSNILLV